MTIVTNKFRADVGLREKYFVETPLEYVFHYLKNSVGAPINPGLSYEICLNIADDKIYKFDGTNWISENVILNYKYLFAGYGSNPAAGCIFTPDMQIYAKNGTSYSKRLIRNGNVIFIRKSSKDFNDNSLLVYDYDNNNWLTASAAITDSSFCSKLDQQLVAGNNINIVHDNAANTLTVSSISSGTTDEEIDDRVANLIQAGSGINVTYNDAANTLTVSSISSGTTDEEIDDRVANLIQAGEGIDVTYNDAANTLTIDSELCESGDSSANKGVSSFDSNIFSVLSGYVSILTMDGGGFV